MFMTQKWFAAGILWLLLACPYRAGAQVEKARWSDRVPRIAAPREFFVHPAGQIGNAGTSQSPWDLASTFAGKHKIPPGSIVWIAGGTYQGKFDLTLAGTAVAPIHLRVIPGQRATLLDGGLRVMQGADYLWLWDLEIAGSIPADKRRTNQTGSHPSDLPGTDGLNIYAGRGCKFINLLIHDNVGNGAGWWVGSIDSEFHGCIIHNNGWQAPDRGHGHCIYTQNREGTKTVSACILSVPYDGSYTMHAYGSARAYVDNYLLQDNIACDKGPFLVGGGRPSHNIRLLRNCLYRVDLRVGYGAANEDCELRDNIIARGNLAILKYQTVVEVNNLKSLPERKAVLIANKYDPTRAHLAVFNGAKANHVEAEVADFLKPGDSFRLLRPTDLHGSPLVAGRYDGKPLAIPMTQEFAPFVLIKE